MPSITGTVNCLQVSEFAGFTTIRDAAGHTETFILWFGSGGGSGIPPELNSFSRVLHSMWVSLLREAHSNGLTVTVAHLDNSAAITSLQLGSIS